ncbi:MAG: hypothetical protein ABI591_00365 [Kofleriaceae bacterium]
MSEVLCLGVRRAVGRRRFFVDEQRRFGGQAFEAVLDVALEPVLAVVAIALVVGINLILGVDRLGDALARRIPYRTRHRGISRLHVEGKSTTHATHAGLLERYALLESRGVSTSRPAHRAAVSLDGVTRAVLHRAARVGVLSYLMITIVC